MLISTFLMLMLNFKKSFQTIAMLTFFIAACSANRAPELKLKFNLKLDKDKRLTSVSFNWQNQGMKLLVVFLVSFLLGVAVRAMWIMAFPLDVTSEMISATSTNITDLTFKTLMSMLWFGFLVALSASGVAGMVLVCKHLLTRRVKVKKTLSEV